MPSLAQCFIGERGPWRNRTSAAPQKKLLGYGRKKMLLQQQNVLRDLLPFPEYQGLPSKFSPLYPKRKRMRSRSISLRLNGVNNITSAALFRGARGRASVPFPCCSHEDKGPFSVGGREGKPPFDVGALAFVEGREKASAIAENTRGTPAGVALWYSHRMWDGELKMKIMKNFPSIMGGVHYIKCQ